MRKLLIIAGALALASTGALAQSSQGQAGAQTGTNGNAPTANSAESNTMAPAGTTTGMHKSHSKMDAKGATGPANQTSGGMAPSH